MGDITKIHDKYFKSVFSRKDVALDMLRMLNNELLDNLDLQTFQLSNASFIDENLKESFADLVYNCQTKSNKKVLISLFMSTKAILNCILIYSFYTIFWMFGMKIKNKKPH